MRKAQPPLVIARSHSIAFDITIAQITICLQRHNHQVGPWFLQSREREGLRSLATSFFFCGGPLGRLCRPQRQEPQENVVFAGPTAPLTPHCI